MRLHRGDGGIFGVSGFAARLFVALFIVLSTYNPSGRSYYDWVAERWPDDWLLQIPVALLYVVAYVILIRATFRSIRPLGVLLVTALMASIVWFLTDAGWVRLADAGDLAVILLYMLGGLLAVGVSWMWLWTRVTGQVSYDNITE